MMNDTMTQQPTDPRLVRPKDGRVIAGVATALARRFGIEPHWIQIAFVVASFFGGLGILLYLIGWLTIPEEGAAQSPAERFVGNLDDSTAWVGGALVVIAGLLVLGATGLIRGEFLLAAALFVAGVMLYRRTGTARPPAGGLDSTAPDDATPPPPEPPPAAHAGVPPGSLPDDETGYQPGPDDVTGGDTAVPPPVATWTAAPPPPPAPPEPPSYLGRIAVACMLIAVGVLALLDNLDVVSPALHHYVGAIVLVCGLGLLVGSFIGRARGLIAIGLLALPLLFVSSLVRVPFSGEWGERTYRPTSAGAVADVYDHGIGELVVDLGEVSLDGDLAVEVDHGIGRVLVLVPEDVSVAVDASVGIGQIDLFEVQTDGLGIEDRYTSIEEGQSLLDVDIELGVGQIVVDTD